MDLRTKKTILKKHKKIVDNTINDLNLKFQFNMTKEELTVLKKIAKANNMEDLSHSIKDISIIEDSDTMVYIKVAIEKM